MNEFKKKVKDKIKQYSNEQYLDGYIRNEFLTDDGIADIYLNVHEKSDIFDTWTTGEQLDLENEVYRFIEEKTEMLGNDIPIRLRISGVEFTAREQEIIRHVLKEHYAIELYKIQKKYIKHRNKAVGLILIGLFSLLLLALVSIFFNQSFVENVLVFLFSFSIWEAMDSVIYNLSEIKYDREAITQNLLIEVIF